MQKYMYFCLSKLKTKRNYICMKKILTVVLCLWVGTTYAYEKNGLTYEIISEEEATVSVSANRESFNEGLLSIPETVEIEGKTYRVTELPYMAFSQLPSLIGVKLPKTIKLISQQAFAECDNLQEVYIQDGCKFEPFVFQASIKLEKVRLPDDLELLPYGTFEYCRNLTDINIPSKLQEIGGFAFSGCWKLNGVQLPSTLKVLNQGAFKYCLSLKEISVPESVTTLQAEAFAGCISLEKTNIPNNMTVIEDAVFDSCLVLKSIVIPSNVEVIRTAAFRDCKSLTSITIPSHVSFIYQEAFAGCTALQEIVSKPTLPPMICERTFMDYTVPLNVPEGAAEAYRKARNWGRFSEGPLLLTLKDAATDDAVSMSVVKGQSIELTIKPAEGWQIYQVSYNNEDITAQMKSLSSANSFVTPAINSNAVLSITYRQTSNGIVLPETDGDSQMTMMGNTIIVKNCHSAVNVYTLQGQLVTSEPTNHGETQFTLPEGKCYLIKAGNKTFKIML